MESQGVPTHIPTPHTPEKLQTDEKSSGVQGRNRRNPVKLKNQDDHIEKRRKHFIRLTSSPSPKQLSISRDPLRGILPHGDKESRRTPTRLTSVDVCRLCHRELPQSSPILITLSQSCQELLSLHLLCRDGAITTVRPTSRGSSHYCSLSLGSGSHSSSLSIGPEQLLL